MANKFKKGDEIIVTTGSNKGKVGRITSISGSKIVVEGVNISTVHKKPSSQSVGEIVKIEKPIHSSNVSHVENGKPIKIKFMTDSGVKNRVSKKSGKKIG
ncbi:MAG: 50S ribosomal protein L24 [Proteobacteria bacterium]|nr:50S ribosomal protein L24 [Pseudomonadota bacterium]